MRRLAHALLAASDYDIRIFVADGLIARGHSAKARPTQLVEHQRGSFEWDSGADRCLARRILPGACGQNLAHYDFTDLVGRNTSALKGGTDRRFTKFARRQGTERAVEGTHRSSGCTCNYYVC
jgi:hypothetical protein